MNKVNALKLADFVLNGSVPFNMEECETCLIGQACAIETGDTSAVGEGFDSGNLCRWLGLDDDDNTRMALYLAFGSNIGFDEVTREQAADMLQALVNYADQRPVTAEVVELAWAAATASND